MREMESLQLSQKRTQEADRGGCEFEERVDGPGQSQDFSMSALSFASPTTFPCSAG